MAVLTGGKTLGLWNKQRNTRTQTRGANGGATPPPSTTRSTNRAPFRTGEDSTTRPKEPVDLRPNERWRAVYKIQAHMAQFREDPR